MGDDGDVELSRRVQTRQTCAKISRSCWEFLTRRWPRNFLTGGATNSVRVKQEFSQQIAGIRLALYASRSEVYLLFKSVVLDYSCLPSTETDTASRMHLMYTLDADGKRVYTLKKVTDGGEITISAHPARFSPDDTYSRYATSTLLYAMDHCMGLRTDGLQAARHYQEAT